MHFSTEILCLPYLLNILFVSVVFLIKFQYYICLENGTLKTISLYIFMYMCVFVCIYT